MRRLLFLLPLTACQAVFPIQQDGADTDLDGSGSDDVITDAKDKDKSASDVFVPPDDSGAPAANVWCGYPPDGGSQTPCKGTCCVKIGSGYQFDCRPLGDPCTGAAFSFSCDDSVQCGNQSCCYTETGMLPTDAGDGGNYRAESKCGSCSPFDMMCSGTTGNCEQGLNCQPWFSNYWVCK